MKKKNKKQKAQIQEIQKLVILKQCHPQNVPYEVVKKQDLLKIKKQVGY